MTRCSAGSASSGGRGTGSRPVYQSYVACCPSTWRAARGKLIAHLRTAGVETTIGTWHMPLTTYFRTRYGYRSGDFPVSDQNFAALVTLPLYERLTDAEQQQVVSRLGQALTAVGQP